MTSVGIDIGGTFTDMVVWDGKRLRVKKVPSTPREPQKGFAKALEYAPKPDEVLHATTIGTNAFLGQRGLKLPKMALVTTLGFRDAIEIGRQVRPEAYTLEPKRPEPLVPRHLRFEVRERTSPDGEIVIEPEEPEVLSVADRIREMRPDVVVVSFLHSYVNPENERKVAAILRRELSGVKVFASHEFCPEYREYERTSTALVNAALYPLVSEYVSETEKIVEMKGTSHYFLMKSDGYTAPAKRVLTKPAQLIESGPAAGVVASRHVGKLLGIDNIISFDMGGTTAKAGTVIKSRYEMTKEYEVGGETHRGRRVRGSGYPILHRFIDLVECSAGGGTIIGVDEAGALKVGPESAGADPGPACYGQGGKDPTITDANVILGRLNPRALLGGYMPIDVKAAQKAMARVARRLDTTPERLALAAVEAVVQDMARIVKIATVEKGYDPRKFTMVAFGGAGPLHAPLVAEKIGIDRVVVPPHPGVFSAYGLLVADAAAEAVNPVMKTASDIDGATLSTLIEEAVRRATRELGTDPDHIEVAAEVRYRGQAYELDVPLDPENPDSASLEEAFHARHEDVYGFTTDEPVEIVNIRVLAISTREAPRFSGPPEGGECDPDRALVEERSVVFEDGVEETPVYNRDSLGAGDVVKGPAIVEEYDSTTLVPSGWRLEVHDTGSLVLERHRG